MKQKLEAAIRDYYEGLGETLTMRHEFPILDTKPMMMMTIHTPI